MDKKTTTDGNYYPIRDKCNQNGDPKEGCITTPALFYQTMIESNDKVNIILKHNDHIILSESYPRHIEYVYNILNFGCSKDKYIFNIIYLIYRNRCESLCLAEGGYLNNITYTCHINKYLQDICIRLKPSENTWNIDDSQ